MPGQHFIPDMDKKILLALARQRSPIHTTQELIKTLNLQKDYFQRMMAGTRSISNNVLEALSVKLDIPYTYWKLEVAHFGSNLGFSRREISSVASITLPGIDFVSRIKDGDHVDALARIIGGYWESYYFSVSNEQELAVSRDLLVVRERNDDGFIECDIVDGHFEYHGYCFPLPNHLYFILEKKDLMNEMIVYCVSRPARRTPVLYGIILCVSGGVEEDATGFPSGARVAFRYLGRRVDDVVKNCSEDIRASAYESPEKLEEILLKTVPRYIYPSEFMNPTIRDIVPKIRNVVTEDQIPLALRMES